MIASGVTLKTLSQIRDEVAPDASPGGVIFPFGILPIASSIGGNLLCIKAGDNQLVWADHGSFLSAMIGIENKETGRWIDLPFDEEGVLRALKILDGELPELLEDLLGGNLTEKLDALD